MKILWLVHMLPYPPSGGSLLRTFHLLHEASRFAEVEVVAFVQRALLSGTDSVAEGVRELERFCRVRSVHPIPHESRFRRMALAATSAAAGRSYTASWTWSAPFQREVERALGEQPDALVLDTIGLVRNLPERALSVPLLLNHHNEEVSMLLRRAERACPAAAWYYRLEARRLRAECLRYFPRVAVHLVTSALDAERLRDLGAGPVTSAVIANGVDTEAYPEVYDATRREPFDLLFIGGGTWYPNRDAVEWLLSEIWPRIRERVPTSRLVLIGRAPIRAALAAAERDARVIVPGFVEDIRPWAANSAAFVCPIRDGGGTRLKVLHAMSLGLPIISTALGAEGIDLREGEHFARAETAEQFAEAVARIWDDEALGRRLSKAGRELAVNRYDWGAVGAALRSATLRGISYASVIPTGPDGIRPGVSSSV